jgi:hypothetical protein
MECIKKELLNVKNDYSHKKKPNKVNIDEFQLESLLSEFETS